jgi:tRNA pseudouridine32 synthase / 23S rRNA pseudouridine746 synthase
MHQGVTASCVALPHGPWLTMLDFLAERFTKINREQWATRMQQGKVLHANGQPVAPTDSYQSNSKLYYYRCVETEATIPFQAQIVFQDALLVVADKPHFLPVIPSGRYVQETLLVRLRNSLGIDTLTPMHRIDLETAGLIVFTIQPHTRDAYQALFRDKKAKKIYHAIAPTSTTLKMPLRYTCALKKSAHFMQIQKVAGQPNSETLISLLESDALWAKYQL